MNVSRGFIVGMSLALPSWAFAAAVPETCYQTGGLANGHTCGHGAFGPFDSRVAQPYPIEQFLLLPNVDPTHTLYSVFLAGQSASNQWTVTYQPIVAGSYAFYMKFPENSGIDAAPYALEIHDGFGDAIPLRFEHGFPSCSEHLTWIKVFDLNPVEYRLVIGGEQGQSVKIAIEHLDSFAGDPLFVDSDGDGHGDPDAQLVSWCGAATGYVSLAEADDCDDDNETAHPGAVETCNGKDDDCNGLVDDGAAVCIDAGPSAMPSSEPPLDMREAGVSPEKPLSSDGGPSVSTPADASEVPSPSADAGAGDIPPPDAGVGEAPLPDTGAGSESSVGAPAFGASPSSPNADASSLAEGTPVDKNNSSTGCSCSMVRRVPIEAGAVSLLLVAALVSVRRRRRFSN